MAGMITHAEFVRHFIHGRGQVALGRMRLCVETRLRGHTVAEIANWLELSPDTVRHHLRQVGFTWTERHWQRGSYFAFGERLRLLGFEDDFLIRIGAHPGKELVASADTPRRPPAKYLERLEHARERYARRLARREAGLL